MVVHAPVAPVAPVYQYAYAPPTRGARRPIVGYRTETRNPPALWGAGLGIFLAGWVLDFAVLTPLANLLSEDRSGANEQDAWAWSLIPIAGPLIQLGIGAPHPAVPILTGLLQLGGLVTFIVGLTSTETHRAAIYQGDPEDPAMLRVELDASPVESGAMIGVTIRHL